MRVFASIWDKGILRGALALTVVLVAATAPAETLRVTAANSVGNSLYDVTSFAPPPGTLSLLNSDGGNHGSFSSVVLVPNLATGTVDALVADLTGPAGAAGGQILRYTPALGSTPASVTIVWSFNGSGPINPDGLSLDSAGNLFIVTSKPPQIWVLPVSAGSPTGFASAPLLIHGSFPTGQGVLQLQDTVVATTNSTVWHTDDVLLMVGNKNSTSNQNTNNDDVYLYKASTIQSVLAGSGPVSAPDQILINGTQFPLGEYGLGLDFWPADFSNPNPHPTLLVLTTAGRILQWDFSSGVPVSGVFASGLGSGLAKLKVGLQLGIPYAYVTQALPPSSNGSGRILQLQATSGVLNIVGTLATPNVMSPDGLAVDPLGAATAASCQTSNGGCDISGVVPHKVVVASDAKTPAGNVIEATCVVPQDPRVDAQGNCPGTLKVSDYCPGFGNEIIPNTLCGGSGVTKTGFALVRTNAAGVDNIAGILVNSEANIEHILPASSNPLCPTSTYAWVPYSAANPSEGTLIPSDVDPGTGFYNFVEMTSFCGTSGGANRGMSVYAVGLIYKPQGTFATDAQNKYQDMFTTVDTANIVSNTRSSLEACLSPITSYIGQADYACAATQTVRCNTQVASDTSPAKHYPGDPLGNPNPWGEIQGRLGNLYMQVNTRLQANPANRSWPLGANDAQPSCAAPVVVSFTATPQTLTSGGTATLSWSTQHAYSCQVGGVTFTGSQAANGTLSTGPLSNTKKYALTCTGISGQVGSSVTVHVSK